MMEPLEQLASDLVWLVVVTLVALILGRRILSDLKTGKLSFGSLLGNDLPGIERRRMPILYWAGMISRVIALPACMLLSAFFLLRILTGFFGSD